MGQLVIESKCFILSKLSEGGVRVTERSWKTEHSVLLGYSSIQWLLKVLEECLREGKKEVYSATRNGFSSIIAQRCENRRGRFIEISEYNQGGRRNVICVPEGEYGRGWRQLKVKLSELGMDGSRRVGGHEGGWRSFGNGPLRNNERSYKEALSVNIYQRQGGEKSRDGGMRDGGGNRNTEGAEGRGHRPWQQEGVLHPNCASSHALCQETWEVRRRLADLQGQLRSLQRDVAVIVNYVGSVKEMEDTGVIKGKEKVKDNGLGYLNKAQQKTKHGKGWVEWRKKRGPWRPKITLSSPHACARADEAGPSRPAGQQSVGLGPGQAHPRKSECLGSEPGSSGSCPNLPLPELSSLGFVPDSQPTALGQPPITQTVPTVAEDAADEMMPGFCAQKALVGFEEPFSPPCEGQNLLLKGVGVFSTPMDLPVRHLEEIEVDEEGNESDDLMHSVEDELFIPEACGFDELSVGSGFQDNKVGNPIPLNYYFPDQVSDWVIHKAKEIQNVVGIACDGYEEQFIALLAALEAGHRQNKKGESKKSRELKRLMWSMNSEGGSSRNRVKGKGLNVSQ